MNAQLIGTIVNVSAGTLTIEAENNQIIANLTPPGGGSKTVQASLKDPGAALLHYLTLLGITTGNVQLVDQTAALGDINTELNTQTVALQGIKTAVEQVGVDRYPNSSFFVATATPPVGASAGDIIQNITVIDTSTNTTVADIWLNKDTGLALGSAPSIGTEVTYVGASGLTYDQLVSAGLATQTTLAAVLAKILTAPATEAKQDTLLTSTGIVSDTIWSGTGNGSTIALLKRIATSEGDIVSGLNDLLIELALKTDYTQTQPVSASSLPLPAGAATETKQDSLIALATTLNGYVDGLEAKDYATQTTLAAVLAKILAAPATEAKQDALIALTTKTAPTDASGTITLGGTAQQLLAANAARVGILFQNISDTDMYLNTTGTATSGAGSYVIKANGGTYTTDAGVKDSLAISLLCATTGKAFTCKWW